MSTGTSADLQCESVHRRQNSATCSANQQRMNKDVWICVLLFSSLSFEQIPAKVSQQTSEVNLVNPRRDPDDIRHRSRRRYTKRVLEKDTDGDIDIEIDPNQITVHTADQQLSINLLGR